MKHYCRNCYYPLTGRAKFCANCGQKDSDGKVTLRNLLGKVWNNTFHLEGKFLRTCWQLLVPGKVSTEYFKGKIDRYPHPIRMFAIVMFFFIILLNKTCENQVQQGEKSSMFSINNDGADNFMDRMKKRAMAEDLQKRYLELPASLRTREANEAVDSLIRTIGNTEGLKMTIKDDKDSIVATNVVDSIPVNLFTTRFKLASADIGRYSADEIIERYKMTGWLDKTLVRQTLKTMHDPQALLHTYIGSLSWALLALSAIMALVLRVLYFRQKRFYVEHFIFMLHHHTGLMLAAVLLLLAIYADLLHEDLANLIVLMGIFGMFFAMWRYYRQGFGKTLLKWFIFTILYFGCFAVLFLMGLLLVFAFF